MEINEKMTQRLCENGICLSHGEARRIQLQMSDHNALHKLIKRHSTSCGECIHLEEKNCCHPESLEDKNWHIEQCINKTYKHKKVT